jgi:hypothetical protein
MKRIGSLIVFCFYFGTFFSQLTENFTDGDFNNNPKWTGDTLEFIVNSDFKLQLDAPSNTDTSYLCVETGTLNFNADISWEFYIKLDFSPSNNNNVRYYLTSNNNNLKGYLEGYFIRVGENGSLDKLKLYRQDGLNTTLLGSSIHTSFGVNPEFRVRVNRDINGNWEVLSDSTGGNNFIYELGVSDNNHTFSTFSGLWCKHTSSNNDNFFFDDINISGSVIVDSLSPYVEAAIVTGKNSIELQFSEPLNQTVLDVNNYNLISSNFPNPSSINTTLSGYDLIFQDSFFGNQTLELTISNIEDLSGNIMFDTLQILVPDTAQAGEVLINEVLFDPLSGGSDYVEIVNNSNKSFDIYKYFIADFDNGISNLKQIDQHFILSPGNFALLSEDSSQILNDYPTNNHLAFIQMDIPSYPNDSATIYILSPDSIVLNKFSYTDDMHFELIKDPEGVSLERILLNSNNSNVNLTWHSAAENVGWGTPGVANSQYISSMSNSDFSALNEVFSPDNDGYQDISVFSYNLPTIGMVGNAVIYDNRGRLIKQILNNELLSTSGEFSWDGINEYGQKASVGIYLVYFECFSNDGQIINYKATITLKTRF